MERYPELEDAQAFWLKGLKQIIIIEICSKHEGLEERSDLSVIPFFIPGFPLGHDPFIDVGMQPKAPPITLVRQAGRVKKLEAATSDHPINMIFSCLKSQLTAAYCVKRVLNLTAKLLRGHTLAYLSTQRSGRNVAALDTPRLSSLQSNRSLYPFTLRSFNAFSAQSRAMNSSRSWLSSAKRQFNNAPKPSSDGNGKVKTPSCPCIFSKKPASV